MNEPTTHAPGPSRWLFNLVLAAFLAIAAFYLYAEHQAHLMGALPWLLLLACPLMHMFMHRGNHGHGHKHRDQDPSSGGTR
jgi:hypothetical protein